jgi:serine/threonine-protein kinase PknK
MMDLTVAPRLPGYRDLTPLGQGGYSEVYRGYQERFDRWVAVKVLTFALTDERACRRFLRECQVAGRVSSHPHIATVYDAGLAPSGRPYIAMELCEGGSVADRLRSAGPFALAEALRIGVAVAGALESAHRAGIVHRDVKPGNVLLTGYGQPALTDFGLSIVAEHHEVTAGVDALSPYYAPPEVLERTRPTPVSDVYALASTVYAMLAGRPPHQLSAGEALVALLARIVQADVPPVGRPDVPRSLDAALFGALARDPAVRTPSALAFAVELGQVMAELGMEVTAPIVLDPPPTPAQPTDPEPQTAFVRPDMPVSETPDRDADVTAVPGRTSEPLPPPPGPAPILSAPLASPVPAPSVAEPVPPAPPLPDPDATADLGAPPGPHLESEPGLVPPPVGGAPAMAVGPVPPPPAFGGPRADADAPADLGATAESRPDESAGEAGQSASAVSASEGSPPEAGAAAGDVGDLTVHRSKVPGPWPPAPTGRQGNRRPRRRAAIVAGAVLAVAAAGGTAAYATAGGGGESAGEATTTTPPTTAPAPTSTTQPPATTTTTTVPPTTAPTTTAPPAPADLPIADVSASATAPDSTDGCGDPTSYGAANAIDGADDTGWSVVGDGTGETLTIRLDGERQVSTVGLLPGFDKVDACSGADRFAENRRPTTVTWRFDDGTEATQRLSDARQVQTLDVDATTSTIEMRIDGVTPAPRRDFTVVSEIAVLGN